jgi:DNA end-binding protein Ku
VQQKVEGHEITMSQAPETGGAQVIDLMEALRASLERKGVKPAAKTAETTKGRKPARRAQDSEAAPAPRKTARK